MPLRALALAAALGLPACQEELNSLRSMDLPWPEAPAPAPPRPAAPPAALDCDDLPALTAAELARPPRPVSLSRSTPAEPAPMYPFTLLPGVTLSGEVAKKLARLDDAYAAETGKHLVVTSGTRDAARQAKAMYKMIGLGADIVGLYRHKVAAREIQKAYDEASGKPPDDVVSSMYSVIQAQIERDVYISAHLRAGAVDIRNRTMSPAEKRAFLKSAAAVGGVRVLEETKPPHYHLQFD